LFVAGELELISREFTPYEEKEGRIRLLKHLMYLSKVFEWSVILKFYTLVVSKIEMGDLWWTSDFEPSITCAIARQGTAKTASKMASKGPSSKRNFKGRPTFCKEFQNNTCQFTEEKHWGMVNGERLQVEHICAACLFKKKEVSAHSESSPDCPCKGGRGTSQ